MGSVPNRKQSHQHRESKKWIRLPANQRCLECYPVRRPFLETAFGKLPPEVREDIFKDVLKVGSLSPLKGAISVPMTRIKHDISQRGSKLKLNIGPAGPASCLALLQTCHQIYHESSLLFYAINTFYFSNPQDMLLFLRHLGPVRCEQLRSLHLEDVLVQEPVFGPKYLDQFRSQRLYSEAILARFSSLRRDVIHPDAMNAVQLLNKSGNLRKIYMDMRPPQTLQYIKLCTELPGFNNREIVFASPSRWSVMVPSTWETKSWFVTFLADATKKSLCDQTYCAYWGGDEKYRVEVDILPALSEARLGSRSLYGW
ncbi:MAG: hypothetical protein ASARMPREDX12_003142 [Alectoria sarmentosa]|nr:MAG: hypothetical protein ASARMPREDX12_003142 [Alectoria sarmentosa]